MKNLQLFDQNHGLSPLQKCQFCLLFKCIFIFSRKACFLTKTSPNTFFWVYFAWNETCTKFQIFDQNHGLTLYQKCQFCGFMKPMLLMFRQACLLYKTSKIVFSRLIFIFRGLQGVTRDYNGLQGITGG